jgi:DNA-binding NtrC family response regulator
LLDAIEALYPWLPVVLTTGYNDEYARIAQEEGQRFVLMQKPYSTEALAVQLHKVVKSRLNLISPG